MKVPKGWTDSCGEGVTIGVIDTGCFTGHKVFQEIDIKTISIENIFDDGFLQREISGVCDENGHGTFVCSIVANLVPRAKIVSIKAVREDGTTDYAQIAKAMYLASAHGCNVINISVGGPNRDTPLRDAVMQCYDRNIAVVCAAGNRGHVNNKNLILYPARYKETIAVGSVCKNEELSFFSAIGDEIDFVAIGEDIDGASIDGGYSTMSGTSFACPYISSIVAMCLSKHIKQQEEGEKNDCKSVQQIKDHIVKYYTKDIYAEGKDVYSGYGVVDVTNISLSKKKEPRKTGLFHGFRRFFSRFFSLFCA